MPPPKEVAFPFQTTFLRHEKKCDVVICLSHLGFAYDNDKVSDSILAKEVEGIDLIIGGHTHTFLEEPVSVQNSEEHSTMINQVGWAGVRLGAINMELAKDKKNHARAMHSLKVQNRA